jgi:hypothetical protein
VGIKGGGSDGPDTDSPDTDDDDPNADIGYLLNPHFMTMYLRYGTRVLDKVPQYRKPGMTVHQFLRDNGALYAVLQSVFNIGIGVRLFRTPPIIFGYADGIWDTYVYNSCKSVGPDSSDTEMALRASNRRTIYTQYQRGH